jgi:hypothetical protein
MLVETMEPATFTLEPNTRVLRNRGNLDVQAFLNATESMSLEDLDKVTLTAPRLIFLLTQNPSTRFYAKQIKIGVLHPTCSGQ